MDSKDYLELINSPFWERISSFQSFLDKEISEGNLWSRIGRSPVDTVQIFQDPLTKECREVLMLGSNNYLGLANEPAIKEKVIAAVKKYGLGTGGSPMFSGYTELQVSLEDRLKDLSGHEAAVVMGGGYLANLGWVVGLVGKNDVVIYDKHSHASTLDGMELAHVQHKFSYDTSDPDMLERLIQHAVKRYPDAQFFLTVEGVHSVDGSVSNLPLIHSIAGKYGKKIFFMLDDAHGLGTLGEHGHGALELFNLKGQVDLRMSTCSKSFGIQAAFLTGTRDAVNYIRNFANPYTFTTGMSVPVLASIHGALDFMEEHPERLRQLHINKKIMQDGLEAMGYTINRENSGIIIIYLPGQPAARINRDLFENGIFVNEMSYPMIAPGQERIRISMMATHTEENLKKALAIFRMIGEKYDLLNNHNN